MPSFFRILFVGRLLVGLGLGAGGLAISGATAAEEARGWAWPLFAGEFGGELAPGGWVPAAGVKWQLTLAPAADGTGQAGTLRLEGVGLQVTAGVKLRSWRDGTWEVPAAEIDLGTWLPAWLARMLPATVGAVTAEGRVKVAGAGTLQDGVVTGRLEVELRDGKVSEAAGRWRVEGLALRGAVRRGGETLAPGQRLILSFTQAVFGDVGFGAAQAELALDPQDRLTVSGLALDAFGGRAEVGAFTLDPAAPEVLTTVNVAGIELGGLSAWLPSVLAGAKGKVGGQATVGWSAREGFRFAQGKLAPVGQAQASITLAASPDLLTSRLPENLRERIDLLPKWLGPLRGLFSPVNPAYATLKAIELGQLPLEVQSVAVRIDPAGTTADRTAQVVVEAAPAGRTDIVESVRLEVNVAGPLAELVRLGMEGKLNMTAR